MGTCAMKRFFSSTFVAAGLTACASQPQSAPVPADAYYSQWNPTVSNQSATDAGAMSPSLWATSPTALLSMRRAKAIGDLLTVVVEIDDKASLNSSLSRSRDSSEDIGIDAFFGLPQVVNRALPGGASASPAFDFQRNSNLNGNGSVNRAEKIAFVLAARVIGLEQNGNLIIQGRQQTQVGSEVRYLSVVGVIRAQDITRTNTVDYEKIADAQLSYVSDGDTTGDTGRRAIPKLLDKMLPF